jgi:hypothetical protein
MEAFEVRTPGGFRKLDAGAFLHAPGPGFAPEGIEPVRAEGMPVAERVSAKRVSEIEADLSVVSHEVWNSKAICVRRGLTNPYRL